MDEATGTTDEALMELIRARNANALAAFYDRYHRAAFSMAYHIANDVGQAEDIVQEAFLSVWRSANTYNASRGHPRGWLLSIVRHRAIDQVSRRPISSRMVELNEGQSDSERAEVWRQVYERMRNEEIRAAVTQLPDEQRITVELAYFGGMSQSEIADRLDVPLGTVKSRIRLAFRKLQAFLERYATEHFL